MDVGIMLGWLGKMTKTDLVIVAEGWRRASSRLALD